MDESVFGRKTKKLDIFQMKILVLISWILNLVEFVIDFTSFCFAKTDLKTQFLHTVLCDCFSALDGWFWLWSKNEKCRFFTKVSVDMNFLIFWEVWKELWFFEKGFYCWKFWKTILVLKSFGLGISLIVNCMFCLGCDEWLW